MPEVGRIRKLDLTIRDNADFQFALEVKDGNNDILPITGWDVKMEFRKNDALVAAFSTSNGFHIYGDDGLISFRVPKETIQSWTFVSGFHDLIVTNDVGHEICYFEGKFKIVRGVTR